MGSNLDGHPVRKALPELRRKESVQEVLQQLSCRPISERAEWSAEQDQAIRVEDQTDGVWQLKHQYSEDHKLKHQYSEDHKLKHQYSEDHKLKHQ